MRSFRKSGLWTAAAVLLSMTLVAPACGGRDDARSPSTAPPLVGNESAVISTEKPQRGGKVAYGLAAETNGWNPVINQFSSPGLTVARTIFDTLTTFADDQSVRPFLAERLDHDADYRTWTIILRPGVKLHNGRAVTADVVKQDQEQLKASPVWSSAYTLIESFSTDGELKLLVHLKERWVTYPSMLTGQLGMVADPDWMKSNDGIHPIGSGPFVMSDWRPGAQAKVKRNEHYWQHDAKGEQYPYLDEIDFEVITDGAARDMALNSSTVDLAQLGDPSVIIDYRTKAASSGYQVLSDEHAETGESFVQLNTAKPPFNDIDARRALAYAINTQDLVDTLDNGLFETAKGPFGKDSRYFADTGYPSFDPDQARRLVDNVKAAHGSFAFTMKGTPDSSKLLQYLQQQWAAVGIVMTIQIVEQAKMIIEVIIGSYEATIWAGFDSPDPLLDSAFWTPETVKPIPEFSVNLARFADPQIGDALRDARQTTDQKQSIEDYRLVARRLGAGVPFVWLTHLQTNIVASSRIVNLTTVRLPDSSMQMPVYNGAHSMHQVWLRR